MQKPETPRLCYFVQEDARIFLCVKSEQTGYLRWEVSTQKAADLSAELARMVSVALKK